MRILYGVQGTGNGHTSRARIMAKGLAFHPKVEVDFLFTGRESDKYFDMQCFGNYQTRTGISFVSHQGAIDNWQTLRSLRLKQFVQDVRSLDLRSYDLVINDFEPVSAWAAKLQRVPSISVSHQAAFSHSVPRKGDTLIDRMVMKYFAPCQISLGVHWYHFGNDILPPFIEDRQSLKNGSGDILVYLPFESIDEIALLLEPLSEVNFHCFHPDIHTPATHGHIHWHRTSQDEFKRALRDCSGVLANGGFELSSECLQLGKKLLIKPLHGQFEQLSNALTLTHLGLGQIMSALETEKVESWLSSSSPEAVIFPHDPQPLIDWILSGQWHNTRDICQSLWKQVQFPEAVRSKLHNLHLV